jgi:ABC-2 type transport system permease protein
MLLRLGGLALTIIPVFFIAQALQPTMAESIAGQGGEYFGFVVLGLIAQRFVASAVGALPGAVRGGIRTGTLEAWLSTPARLPALILGISSYELLWSTLSGTLLLTAAATLGAEISPMAIPGALFLLVLVVASYLPIALISAAMIFAFRTAGPIGTIAITGSTFLGGVFYPVEVIPGWLEAVARVIPLTYGLRALRKVLLEGSSLAAVGPEIASLVALTVILALVGGLAFARGLRYARRSGSLAQY